ncbi:Bug family tripartite tricarboxylate transporter substrate binding protein [Roseomonas sp. BN140053]|uniref:Bug family tripartite tricarboxylate transporter substrate binding protein n=1 Tax=Roseomonas sp. BN140053 TaxID=3391898 RepID=UPI0039EA286D
MNTPPFAEPAAGAPHSPERPPRTPQHRDGSGHPVLRRRATLGGALAGALLAAAPRSAAAQGADPLGERPFSLMVPFSPGTTIDVLGRLISEHLRKRIGAVAAVENRVGGSGTIATQAVARAQPDGHTLLVTTTTFVTAPSLVPGNPYDPIADFAPVANLATGAMALCVHPALGVSTVAEFVERAKAQPGKIDYASIGNGSPQHLAMALFTQSAKIQLTHVPYRGSAGALQDLAAGTVTAMVVPVNSAVPLRRDGRLRMLAVASGARAGTAPDVPTLAEAGFPGLEMDVWYGLLAPARTPPAVIRRLNEEMALMLRDPAVEQLLRNQDLVPAAGPPEAFAALLAAEKARWTGVIRAAGITAD